MLTERTRYSKHPNKSNRKNTLFTFREGDFIYFGISRCNLNAGDKFTKKQGYAVAKARAYKASEEFLPPNMAYTLTTHENGLRGVCQVKDVHKLLQYFENIDEFMAYDLWK